MLGGAGVLIWNFVGQPDLEEVKDFGTDLGDKIGDWDFGDSTDVLDNITGIEDLFDEDPFLNNTSTSSWPSQGEGLELEMLNALDDTWQEEFTAALSDWENGDPDALTLIVKEDGVDHNCTPVQGLMKVCNGNFGDTGWFGINQIIKRVPQNIILNSVAKMNEYYLLNADDIERQYTMCHEIGHGFGLRHTDENYDNADLGNCLDYTRTPANNLHPDTGNYQRLVSLYGEVPARRRRLWSSSSSSSPTNRRILSPELLKEYEEAIRELEQVRVNPDNRESEWRLLREHLGGAEYVRRLGSDHVLEVHMLYTFPTSN
jgi:hypothetical protein